MSRANYGIGHNRRSFRHGGDSNEIRISRGSEWFEFYGPTWRSPRIYEFTCTVIEIVKSVGLDDEHMTCNEEPVREILHAPIASDQQPSVQSVAWSPDGLYLVTVREAVRFWDARSGALKGDISHPFIRQALFSADGSVLYTFSNARDDAARAWDVASRRLLWKAGNVDGLPFAIDPLGRYIAVINRVGVYMLDARTGEPAGRSYLAGIGAVVAFSPDGRLLAAFEGNRPRFLVVDVESGKVQTDINFAPNAFIIHEPRSPEEDDEVDEKWDDLRRTKEIFGDWWGKPAFSPAGNRVAAANENGTTYILSRDARRGDGAWRLEHRLPGLLPSSGEEGKNVFEEIKAISWSLDGQLLARAHLFGQVSLVETRTWKIVCVLDGHKSALPGRPAGANDLAFSPGGNFLASVGMDNAARIWRVPKESS